MLLITYMLWKCGRIQTMSPEAVINVSFFSSDLCKNTQLNMHSDTFPVLFPVGRQQTHTTHTHTHTHTHSLSLSLSLTQTAHTQLQPTKQTRNGKHCLVWNIPLQTQYKISNCFESLHHNSKVWGDVHVEHVKLIWTWLFTSDTWKTM